MAEEEKTVNKTITTEEEALMIIASRKRVNFKIHLTVFVVINLIIWALWFTLFKAIVDNPNISNAIFKSSLCITVVWLLIVILHYLIAYKWNKTLVEKELSNLKKQRAKQLKAIEKLKAQIAETKKQLAE